MEDWRVSEPGPRACSREQPIPSDRSKGKQPKRASCKSSLAIQRRFAATPSWLSAGRLLTSFVGRLADGDGATNTPTINRKGEEIRLA